MSTTLELPNWGAFRDICFSTKNLNNQFTEDSNCYDLYGPDANGLIWHVRFNKSDAAEFEGSYKSKCNFAIGQRAYPFSTSDMQFAGLGFHATADKNAVTDLWMQLADGFYLSGGEFYTVGAVAGDKMDIDVVDKDGLYFPAGTVLVSPSYMKDWNVHPQDYALSKFERSYSAKPPPGIYLRFKYISVGTVNNVALYCNLYLHKPL